MSSAADGSAANAAAGSGGGGQPQPLPRRGAYSKHIQSLHKDQLSKLQAKNSQEIDLLDQIKTFVRQKCAAEKAYAETMLKVSTNHLNHKMAAIPDVQKGQDEQVRQHSRRSQRSHSKISSMMRSLRKVSCF